MEEEDADETEGQLADTAVDTVDVLRGPQPGDARQEEVGAGSEDSEGEVRANEVVTVCVLVEAEVASVVTDGEADGEHVDGEEDH